MTTFTRPFYIKPFDLEVDADFTADHDGNVTMKHMTVAGGIWNRQTRQWSAPWNRSSDWVRAIIGDREFDEQLIEVEQWWSENGAEYEAELRADDRYGQAKDDFATGNTDLMRFTMFGAVRS